MECVEDRLLFIHIIRVVYCDVMTASRRHDTTGRDGPLCHDTIGSA